MGVVDVLSFDTNSIGCCGTTGKGVNATPSRRLPADTSGCNPSARFGAGARQGLLVVSVNQRSLLALSIGLCGSSEQRSHDGCCDCPYEAEHNSKRDHRYERVGLRGRRLKENFYRDSLSRKAGQVFSRRLQVLYLGFTSGDPGECRGRRYVAPGVQASGPAPLVARPA